MKRILIPFALAFNVYANDYTQLPYDGTYDGDTIYTHLELPEPLNKAYIRLYGIDTPEKGFRAKCDQEAVLAEEAHTFLEHVLKYSESLYLTSMHWDKYGGRILAKVFVRKEYDDGEAYYIEIAPLLVKEGYAVSYYGDKKTHNWCSK